MKTLVLTLSILLSFQIFANTDDNDKITTASSTSLVEAPFINIKMDEECSMISINGNSTAYQYSISNYSGEELICVKVNANAFKIQIDSLQPGIYYITLIGKDKNIKIQKFKKV